MTTILSDSVNVLGTVYKIDIKTEAQDEYLKGLYAYIFYAGKQIVLLDLIDKWKDDPVKTRVAKMRESLRHEIIHAFLHESGLNESTLVYNESGWAKNEEMIDWLAIQSPKIFKAMKDSKCL